MKKRDILIIIISAITIFNLSALATIFFTQYYRKTKTQTVENETDIKPTSETGVGLPDGRYALWFREQLHLDNEQFEVFRSANRKYHQEGATILDELNTTRTAIVDELGREIPDEGELKYLAQRVGELHVQLKELTIAYYLTMKDACRPEQKIRLYEIFKAMTDAEGNAAIPGN